VSIQVLFAAMAAIAAPARVARWPAVRTTSGRWLPSVIAVAIEPGPTVSGMVSG